MARRWQQGLPVLLPAEPFRPSPDGLNRVVSARYYLLTIRAETLEAAALQRRLPAAP